MKEASLNADALPVFIDPVVNSDAPSLSDTRDNSKVARRKIRLHVLVKVQRALG